MIPGEYLVAPGDIPLNPGRATRTLVVKNASDRPIQVSSHYHATDVWGFVSIAVVAAVVWWFTGRDK